MSNNRLFLLVVLGFTLLGMFKLYSPFLLDIVIAALLAVTMNNINIFILKFVKQPVISASLTTIILLLMFFAPLGYVIAALADSLLNIDNDLIDKFTSSLSSLYLSLPEYIRVLMPNLADLDRAAIASQFVGYAATIGKVSAGFLKDVILIVVFFFFVLFYGKDLAEYFKSVMPMDKKDVNDIFFEVTNVMSVVLYSVVLTAVLEGILFAIVAAIYGYNALMLGILYGFASLIPIIGGAIVWVPLALLHLSTGDTFGTIVIAAYSFIGIGTVDNFIKPLIIKYVNQILVKTPVYFNPLLIFFSILAGLSSFGFWGMILGPALTTFFVSLLKTFRSVKEKNLKKTD